MTQNLVLLVVIVVSIWAHVHLYLWIRFKMDEGLILRCLKDCKAVEEAPEQSELSLDELVQQSGMKAQRVRKVCQRSKDIYQRDEAYHC